MPPTIVTEDISRPNKRWGICGFASSIAAMYENHVLTTTVLRKHYGFRLLAEIKTYLVTLQAGNETVLLNQIQAFTRTFKGYEDFSIEQFIQKINSAPETGLGGEDFSLAMPAPAVVDYLKRIHDKTNARLVPLDQKLDNVILGLVDDSWWSWAWGCGGLKHWVYKKNDNEVYNWGKKKSLADVLSECAGYNTIGYQIAF